MFTQFFFLSIHVYDYYKHNIIITTTFFCPKRQKVNDVLYTAEQVYTFIHCPSFFSSSSLVYGSVIFLLLNPPNTLLRHCLYVYVVKKRKKVTDPIYNKIILRFYLYSNNKYKNKIKPIYELSS